MPFFLVCHSGHHTVSATYISHESADRFLSGIENNHQPFRLLPGAVSFRRHNRPPFSSAHTCASLILHGQRWFGFFIQDCLSLGLPPSASETCCPLFIRDFRGFAFCLRLSARQIFNLSVWLPPHFGLLTFPFSQWTLYFSVFLYNIIPHALTFVKQNQTKIGVNKSLYYIQL